MTETKTITTDRKQLDFAVQGMTCASCVNHVQKALSRVDGVHEVKDRKSVV